MISNSITIVSSNYYHLIISPLPVPHPCCEHTPRCLDLALPSLNDNGGHSFQLQVSHENSIVDGKNHGKTSKFSQLIKPDRSATFP